MNVQQLRDQLNGFPNDTEVKIGGWRENPRSATGFTYEVITLGSQHIFADKSPMTNKTTIHFECDAG